MIWFWLIIGLIYTLIAICNALLVIKDYYEYAHIDEEYLIIKIIWRTVTCILFTTVAAYCLHKSLITA